MLSASDNELLTRVGPGTPMGKLLRAYWLPALLVSELPTPQGPPVRVMLLGERLVAFRDAAGRVGLVAEQCPHRGASLFLGRCTTAGLRCAYHGWTFDTGGHCTEMPTEPTDSTFKSKIRATTYPCRERGGIVWAYLGASAEPPPLPALDANLEELGGRADATLTDNNWLQSLEGDLDLPHIPNLHTGNLVALENLTSQSALPRATPERMATFEVGDTPAGFAFAGAPPPRNGRRTWSVGHFMFPCFANLPYGTLGSHWAVARVPLDDHHTMTYGMWNREAQVAPRELMFGTEPSFLPNTTDWFGRFRLARNPSNDFLIDRGLAARGASGISGQAVEDIAVTTSMGPIVDRTREHLGSADVAIIHVRRRLLAVLRAFETEGAPAAAAPNAYRVKHGSFRIAEDASWFAELVRQHGAGG